MYRYPGRCVPTVPSSGIRFTGHILRGLRICLIRQKCFILRLKERIRYFLMPELTGIRPTTTRLRQKTRIICIPGATRYLSQYRRKPHSGVRMRMLRLLMSGQAPEVLQFFHLRTAHMSHAIMTTLYTFLIHPTRISMQLYQSAVDPSIYAAVLIMCLLPAIRATKSLQSGHRITPWNHIPVLVICPQEYVLLLTVRGSMYAATEATRCGAWMLRL